MFQSASKPLSVMRSVSGKYFPSKAGLFHTEEKCTAVLLPSGEQYNCSEPCKVSCTEKLFSLSKKEVSSGNATEIPCSAILFSGKPASMFCSWSFHLMFC